MSYRKLKADYLFDGYKMLRDVVLICDEEGTVETILEENQAGDNIEYYSGILCPGFINCHCHLELSHLKGLIPEKQGLVDFVFSVVSQRNQPDDSKQVAIIKAESDMSTSGIVAVGDICNSPDTIILKSGSRLNYYNFIELLGWTPERAEAVLENGKQLALLFNETRKDGAHTSLCPHAPYSVSDKLWNIMTPGFKGKTVTIHNQESAAENVFFETGLGDLNRMYTLMEIESGHFKAPGTTSLQDYLPKLKSAARILLVHNTFSSEKDLITARDFSDHVFFCLCPNANLYIEDRLPDIGLFEELGARIVLGTDSLASNHQLSILEEMKTIKKYFPLIKTSHLLIWACSNGAKALDFENKLGDFKKGKQPGVVLIGNIVAGEITADSVSRRLV